MKVLGKPPGVTFGYLLGAFGAPFGLFWVPLGISWGDFGAPLGAFWASLGALGEVFERLLASLGYLGGSGGFSE